jgi:hypothetical protein
MVPDRLYRDWVTKNPLPAEPVRVWFPSVIVRYTTNPHGSFGAMHIIRVDVTFFTAAKVAFIYRCVNCE